MKKKCSKCGVEKEVEEFYKHKTGRLGVAGICKSCEAEKKRVYYEQNRVKVAEYNRAYREQNKDGIAERKRAWYEQNHVKVAEKNRAMYEQNREKYAEKHRLYYVENKKRIVENSRAYYEQNQGKIAVYKRSYHERNREKHVEKRRAWYEQNREKASEYSRDYHRLNRDALSDVYVTRLLKDQGIHDPSPELIELKREQLMLYRMTKELFKALNEVSDESNRVDEGAVGDEPDK